jgi:hypothetical protein
MTGEQVMVPEADGYRWSIITILFLATTSGVILTEPSIGSPMSPTGFDWPASGQVQD